MFVLSSSCIGAVPHLVSFLSKKEDSAWVEVGPRRRSPAGRRASTQLSHGCVLAEALGSSGVSAMWVPQTQGRPVAGVGWGCTGAGGWTPGASVVLGSVFCSNSPLKKYCFKKGHE